MEAKSASLSTKLYTFLRPFVTPRILPDSEQERLRANLSLLILACFALLGILNALVWLIANSLDIISVIACISLTLVYLFGRFVSHHWALRALIITFIAIPYLNLLLAPEILDLLTILATGFLALLITSQLSSFRTTIIIATMNLTMIFPITFIIKENSSLDTISILVPSIGFTGLFLLNAYQHEHFAAKSTTAASPFAAYDNYSEAVLIQYDNLIAYANLAAAQFLGYTLDKLIGAKIESVLELENSGNYHFKNLDGQMIVHYEANSIRHDKSILKVQVSTNSIRYEDGLATLFSLRPLVADEIALLRQMENTLAEREQTFRTVSELMSDYAYALDIAEDGKLSFSWAAGALSKIIGRSEHEVMALEGWESIIHPDDLAFYQLRQQALLKGDSRTLEYRILRPSGAICWVQDKAYPLYDKQEKRVIRILGSAHDVTERIHTQEVLRNHVVQQAVVAELGLLALSLNEASHILNHAAVLCEQVLEGNLCLIFEHDEANHRLICVSKSREDDIIQLGDTISDNPHESLAAHTLLAKEAIVSEDLQDEVRFRPLQAIADAQFSSAMGVFILGQDKPYGVLTIYSNKHQVFDKDEVYFLQSVANVLGTFIERNRAQNAEREEHEFAEALREATAIINSRLELPDVLGKILDYLRQVVPQMESASIMLKNVDTELYEFVSTWGFVPSALDNVLHVGHPEASFPLLAVMLETQQPIILNDISKEPRWTETVTVENVASYLGAPIIVQGDCIGFLHVNSSVKNAYNEKDAHRLQSFADKTGTAITNARRAEELERLVQIRTQELDKQREQLSTILESTGEGIFYVENEKISFANARLCELTGYRLEELINQDSHIFIPEDQEEDESQRFAQMEESLQRGEIARTELRLVRKDGTSFAAGITSTRVGEAEAGLVRKVSIIRDISQEKALAEMKNRFIANAAHDLRSPITSLKTRMYMIQKQPEQMPSHLEKLEQVINRMNRLVGDLLDTASFGQGKVSLRPEAIILQHLLQQVSEILRPEAEQAGLKLWLEIPDAPIQIWADSVRLEQVFTNLITNAIHYTPKGEIKLICRINGSRVQVEVADTGLGIPQDSLELIFQAFFRINPEDKKGTGLGLNITRDIVERHGGTIEVASKVGEGSRFIVTLPLLQE